VELPVFSYNTTWYGASVEVTQFNFSSTDVFTLRRLPTVPSGVNFLLCLKWRNGSVVTRYKLWENVGEVLNVPLYGGQIIPKNFVLEVWNLENGTVVSNASVVKIFSSLTQVPDNYQIPLVDFILADGVECNNLNGVAVQGTPLDLTNIVARYAGATLVPSGNYANTFNEWIDVSGSAFGAAPFATGLDIHHQPQVLLPAANCTRNFVRFSFDGTDRSFLCGSSFDYPITVYIVMRFSGNSNPQDFFRSNINGIKLSRFFTGLGTAISASPDAGGATLQSQIVPIGTFFIVKATWINGTHRLRVANGADLSGNNTAGSSTAIGSPSIGADGGIVACEAEFAEILIYNENIVAGGTKDAQIMAYLTALYLGGNFQEIVMTYDTGVAWLDNP